MWGHEEQESRVSRIKPSLEEQEPCLGSTRSRILKSWTYHRREKQKPQVQNKLPAGHLHQEGAETSTQDGACAELRDTRNLSGSVSCWVTPTCGAGEAGVREAEGPAEKGPVSGRARCPSHSCVGPKCPLSPSQTDGVPTIAPGVTVPFKPTVTGVQGLQGWWGGGMEGGLRWRACGDDDEEG